MFLPNNLKIRSFLLKFKVQILSMKCFEFLLIQRTGFILFQSISIFAKGEECRNLGIQETGTLFDRYMSSSITQV